MVAQTHQFGALDTIVEEAHAFFEPLLVEPAAPQRASMMLHLQLAVHEWLANLVQHARFSSGPPEVTLVVDEQDAAVACTIEDNSEGFNLDEALEKRRQGLSPLPERGMGLLILFACASEIQYDRNRGGRNCLRFVISSEGEKTLNIPF